MSLPQQQQQQPVIYPNTVTRQAPSHSDGSFGTVFIVLGVILVVSVIACVLGRLCNRRRRHHHHHQQKPKQNPAFRPKEPDIEFGLDRGMPTAKPPAGNGGAKPNNGHRPFEIGEIRGEPKPWEAPAA